MVNLIHEPTCLILFQIIILGTLKEGDYLLQAGVYSLIGIDITIVLVLIERAYDEGRKVDLSDIWSMSWVYFIQSVSFVAARQEKPDRQKQITKLTETQNAREE